MNAVIYCRVSSREQVEGTSLDSQESACREYAHKHNLTVSRVFVEEGESAKFADRTQLLELLDYCRNKAYKVDVLIVWKIDRFARNVEDHYTLKAALRKSGVNIVSVTEPIQSDPNGKLLETILAGFAQFDNDIRAIRSVQGMQQRLRDGIFPWKPPLGYLPPKQGRKTEPDRPDPHSFELIRKGWQLFATGAYTKVEILNLLRSWGVTGYRGGLLGAQLLDYLFRNPYYAGVLRDPWTGTEYPGRHVQMVTREEFAAVQLVTSRRANARAHNRVHPAFPLRALVRCPSCCSHMTSCFARGRRQRYPYYHCFKRNCPTRTKSYPSSQIHQEFEDFIRSMSVPEHLARRVLDEMSSMLTDQETTARQASMSVDNAMRALGRQLQELISMRSLHAISADEFLEQRQRLDVSLSSLRAAALENVAQSLTTADADEFFRLLADLKAAWESIAFENRRVFGSLLFPAGYVSGRIRTADRGLLFTFCGGSEAPESNGAALVRQNVNTLVSEIHRFLAVCRSGRRAARSHLKAA